MSQALFLEPKVGPKWDPNRIFDAKAFRKPLGALLERFLEPLGASWKALAALLQPLGALLAASWGHIATPQIEGTRPRKVTSRVLGLGG